MKLVVDANLVFSCILRSDGAIGDLLLRASHLFDLFAPELIAQELANHREKLIAFSRLDDEAIDIVQTMILDRIQLVDEVVISKVSLQDAERLLGPIDSFDVPYLALALELDCMLWTGDRKVFKGLRKRGFKNVIDTAELLRLRDGL